MATRPLARLLPSVQSSALLICDIQERFRPLIFNMRTVIDKAELLNRICNVLEIPAIISEQNPRALGTTVPEITKFPTTFTYEKSKFSMYTDELATQLDSKRQVILVGIETHVCVLQTALDLLAQDLDVFVVCDAVSSQRPYDRAVALQTLKEAGARLTTTESIVFALMRDAKHPKFREISGMIKEHNASAANEFASDKQL